MTRHELKEQLQHDQFTDSVSSALVYASSHKRTLTKWGIAVAALVLVGIGIAWMNSYRRSQRQQDLQAAFQVLDAQVGPPNEYAKTFATQDEKTQASIKALAAVVAKDGGTSEGYLAQYYLGTLKAQKGDNAAAEADLRAVAASDSDSAALAKIALAQLYLATKRTPEAQALLRTLVDKPTDLVSKGQAQILLAQIDSTTSPQDARKLLQSLKTPTASPAVTRAADQLLAELNK